MWKGRYVVECPSIPYMETVFSLVGLIYYMHVQSILSFFSPRAAGVAGRVGVCRLVQEPWLS